MALTVRPDDEVYQFDTVWLGPDEYTLPIQARYVAWGTWLACFLVAAVVLIPIGGDGPAGVFGSLIWALGLSVVLSRAVMLVVDHERPLRSLPALFGAEARAAVQNRRRADRALLVRPRKIVVRETPPKVVALRAQQRSRVEARADRRRPVPVEPDVVVEVFEPDWAPDLVDRSEPAPAWSIPTDVSYDADSDTYAPVPVPYGTGHRSAPYVTPQVQDPYESVGFVRPGPVVEDPAGYVRPAPMAAEQPGRHAATARPGPFRSDPHHPEDRPYRGPVTVVPDGDPHGRHARPGHDDGRGGTDGRAAPDGQAAIEARILLPARKDR